MYLLLSSTRYDETLLQFDWNDDIDGPSPFFLLSYHFERLLEAAEQHNWLKAKRSLSYGKLKKKCLEKVNETEKVQAVKVRMTLSEEGELDMTVSAVIPFTSDPVKFVHLDPTECIPSDEQDIVTVYLDSCITASSLFTRTKTTNRIFYDAARARARITSSASEVVLYNSDSLITEASISNVYFFREGRWLTPSASTGCLPGVIRRWLLDRGLVDEDNRKQLTTQSVLEGEWVLLSNGVQGCRLGRITLTE